MECSGIEKHEERRGLVRGFLRSLEVNGGCPRSTDDREGQRAGEAEVEASRMVGRCLEGWEGRDGI